MFNLIRERSFLEFGEEYSDLQRMFFSILLSTDIYCTIMAYILIIFNLY